LWIEIDKSERLIFKWKGINPDKGQNESKWSCWPASKISQIKLPGCESRDFVCVLLCVITKLLVDFQLLRMEMRCCAFSLRQRFARSQYRDFREAIGKICNEEFIFEYTLDCVKLFP
jgi:hypothetical protein